MLRTTTAGAGADQAVLQMLAHDGCARAHGIRVVHVEDGYAELTMTVRDDMLNAHGICHGGMTFMLADTALAYAASNAEAMVVSTSASIVYSEPVCAGDQLTAVCRMVHQGPKAGVADVEVRTEDGVLVALFRGQTLLTRTAPPVSGAR